MSDDLFREYSADQHILVWKGIEAKGVAEGTFFSAERAEDSVKVKAGGKGAVVRSRMLNRIAQVTITLLPTSPTNTLFSAVLAADEAGITVGAGVGPLLIKDLNGATILSAENAWIRKMPKKDIGDEPQNVEWILDCDALVGVVGGSFA
jgi:hypothetical protein